MDAVDQTLYAMQKKGFFNGMPVICGKHDKISPTSTLHLEKSVIFHHPVNLGFQMSAKVVSCDFVYGIPPFVVVHLRCMEDGTSWGQNPQHERETPSGWFFASARRRSSQFLLPWMQNFDKMSRLHML
ncbi:MAG: hypothetical protein HQL63_07080 [Magnetococcales bacterium]|nr:hypothetical protein [Magnetococcales bacterium]MBF0322925.1 hypothetical protein [Magnetococcales bacterium]